MVSRDWRSCGLSGSSECRTRRSTTDNEWSFQDRVQASDVNFMAALEVWLNWLSVGYVIQAQSVLH
jgi:hypothetical protein